MSEDFKLRVSAEGAAETKRAIDDVVEATKDAGKASKEAAAGTREQTAAVNEARKGTEDWKASMRAQNAEMAAHAKALNEKARQTKAAAQADAEAAAAAKEEAAALARVEQQAERTRNAVEKLALANGRSAEAAEDMADAAASRVRGGENASVVVNDSRRGFRAERIADRNAGDSRIVGAMSEDALRLNNALDQTAAKGGKLLTVFRGAANAFLPDQLVSRAINVGALIAGMSTGAIALAGVIAGPLVIAAGYFVGKWEAAKAAAERTGEAIKWAGEAAAEAARRQNAIDSKKLDEVAAAWKRAAENTREATAAVVANTAATSKNLQQQEAMLNARQKEYEEQVRLDAEKKLAATSDPEARRRIEGERDDLLARVGSRGDVARADARLNAARATAAQFSPENEELAKERIKRAVSAANAAESEASAEYNRRRTAARNQIDDRVGGTHSIEEVSSDQQRKLSELQKRHADASGEEKRDLQAQITTMEANLRSLETLKMYRDKMRVAAEERAKVYEEESKIPGYFAQGRQDAAVGVQLAESGARTARSTLERTSLSTARAAGDRTQAEKDRKAKEDEKARREAEKHAPEQARAALGERAREVGSQAERMVGGINTESAAYFGANSRQKAAIRSDVDALRSAAADAQKDGATDPELAAIATAMRALVEDFREATGKDASGNAQVQALLREVAAIRTEMKNINSRAKEARNF